MQFLAGFTCIHGWMYGGWKVSWRIMVELGMQIIIAGGIKYSIVRRDLLNVYFYYCGDNLSARDLLVIILR